MSLDFSTHGKNIIEEVVKKKYVYLYSQNDISRQVTAQIEDWQFKTKLEILQQDIFSEHQSQLTQWLDFYTRDSNELNPKAVEEYLSFCSEVGVPANLSYWKKALEENKDTSKQTSDKKPHFQLLLHEWQKHLDVAQARWQLEELQSRRDQFLEQLIEWMELIKQLDQNLCEFGFELGVWFDDSLGSLSKQNIDVLKRWLNYLQNDEGVKKISDLLGKMRQIEHTSEIERVQQTIELQTPIVDTNSKEEIIGLRLAKDLEHALPSELALMSDPDTAILFDLKYLEAKLLCFELQGLAYQKTEVEITVEVEKETEEKLGPMILCVDTSGSMQGTPESIAKAVTLFLGVKAKNQNRPCFVINFSTNIETFEVTGATGIAELTGFLSQSFHGGTDVAPALRYAIKLLETEKYEKSDVLVISDFVMSDLPESLLKDLEQQKLNGNQFNSLVIGDLFMYNRVENYFDNEFIYNPKSHQIQELLQFTALQKSR